MPRRRPDKEKVKVSKARVKSEPKSKASVSAPKPYLRVPADFLASNEDNAGGGEDLPKAENLFRKHLFNQSVVSGW